MGCRPLAESNSSLEYLLANSPPPARGCVQLRVSSLTFAPSTDSTGTCLTEGGKCHPVGHWQQWASPGRADSTYLCLSASNHDNNSEAQPQAVEKENRKTRGVIVSALRCSSWVWVCGLLQRSLPLRPLDHDSELQRAPVANGTGSSSGMRTTSWFRQGSTSGSVTSSNAVGRNTSAGSGSVGGTTVVARKSMGTGEGTRPPTRAEEAPRRRGFLSSRRSCLADYLLVLACLSILLINLPYLLMLPLSLPLALPDDGTVGRPNGSSIGWNNDVASAAGSFHPSGKPGHSTPAVTAADHDGMNPSSWRGITNWLTRLPLRCLLTSSHHGDRHDADPMDAPVHLQVGASGLKASSAGSSSAPHQPDAHPEMPRRAHPPSHLRSLVDSRFFSPHAILPLHRGHSSGICIAVTSAPRRVGEGEEKLAWGYAEQLLHLLDERRARAPLLERDMWAVVHASGCEVSVADGVDLSHAEQRERFTHQLMREAKGRPKWFVERLVEALRRQQMRGVRGLAARHSDALRNISQGLQLEAYAVPAHKQACALMQNVSLLLRVVEPDMVRADGWDRWLWRTKLAIDFVYVMHQCLATRPRYILMLQDDTRPTKLWDVGIERFISRDLWEKPAWTMLSLYHPHSYRWGTRHAQEYKLPCCAQALLFDASKVLPLLNHMEAEFMVRPMDLNIQTYLENSDSHAYVHVPSLFQHTGKVRTNALRVTYHYDPLYQEDVIANPYEGQACTKIEPPSEQSRATKPKRGYPPVELMADPSSITIVPP